MFARLTGLSGLALALAILVGCNSGSTPNPNAETAQEQDAVIEIGAFLYGDGPSQEKEAVPTQGAGKDPVLIPDCRFTVCQDRKQEVPSQRDGVLLFIGTEIKDGEEVPPDRLIKATIAEKETVDGKERVVYKEKKFRQLRDGDRVEAGQLLAVMDHRLAFDDWQIKDHQVEVAKLEKQTSERTRDEAYQRLLASRKIYRNSPESEELRGAEMTYHRYMFEAMGKDEGIKKARAERQQSQTVLEMHQVRSTVGGQIRSIYKSPGESVKASEPVFLIHNCDRLQIDGLIDVADLYRLRDGVAKVVVEPSLSRGSDKKFEGRHRQEVTCVAVARGPEHLIVTGSEDRTVRVWDRKASHELRVLQHPVAVRAVACTPEKADANLVLSGGSDGKARLWDLERGGPSRELKGQHRGAITCAAFSPDGKWCLTGGDDREIMLWDVVSGELKYKFAAGHRGAVTSLYFTPQSQVVSSGRDNTLRLWTLGQEAARPERAVERRSGDLTNLGISPDGKLAFFEQGKQLSILDMSMPDYPTKGVLQNSSGTANFSTFALFSPDGGLILTAGGADGRLQLWRPPTATTHGYEVRQFNPRERSIATCAAFSPDGSFIATGTRDSHVYIWPVPTKAEIERELPALGTRTGNSLEAGGRQVRIWAEVDNPDGSLLIPGNTANLAIYLK